MKRWAIGFAVLVVLVCAGQLRGDIVTAEVQVVNSPAGRFIPLEIGSSWAAFSDRGWWYSFPQIIEQQPLHFWQVLGEGSNQPAASYGIISFDVLTDGPVLLAVTNRWGGGGNPSGDVDWIPQLTSYDDFLAQGWTEYASPLLEYYEPTQSVSDTTYTVYKRDSFAGESFTLRAEKYVPPLLLTTQFIPEPTAVVQLLGLGIMGALALTIGRWRRRTV